MNKLFVIQTKFSVFNKNLNPSIWQAGKNSRDPLTVLLDEKRLKDRCDIFFNFQLPLINLAFQNGIEIIHQVHFFSGLPDWVIKHFDDARIKYSWFQPKAVSYEDDLSLYDDIRDGVRLHVAQKENLNGNVICAGVRLDDDDLILPRFFEKMQNYLDYAFVGFCISFPMGFAGVYKEGFKEYYEFYEAKVALGLSQIFMFNPQGAKFENNYLLPPGAHGTVDQRVPVVLDATSERFYVRTFHENNDFMINRSEDSRNKYLGSVLVNKIDLDISTYLREK